MIGNNFIFIFGDFLPKMAKNRISYTFKGQKKDSLLSYELHLTENLPFCMEMTRSGPTFGFAIGLGGF